MRRIPLLFAAGLVAGWSGAAELPLVYSTDFSDGAAEWTPTDPEVWKITTVEDNAVYENIGGSNYQPPHRSPRNISLLDDVVVGDFVLTARVQTTKESYGHRDMCLFFGHQDPAHFYYVHLGQKRDPHANQIFLVNEAPRVAISEKATDGTPWEDGRWHEVKVVRDADTGRIEVYFDDMDTPTHVARDKTFTRGRIGLGTFDDKGLWDDVELRGEVVERPGRPERAELRFEKWTPHFQVPDPVAIAFDSQGRAYVTQTRRRKANDLDIRRNRDWLEDDLSFESTEDKRAFYREQFTPANSDANARRVEDYTGDGVHDVRDLTALSERIHLIADTDGDGHADTIQTYAEELDGLISGVAGGVLFRQGDVYACPVPELVRFRDTDGDGTADEKEVLVSGFGVHLAYAGHDMHGLLVGPDGRIYWSVGDKGIRVKTEGRDWRFPNQGGLMRCEPDGSNFEVYAHGQRNIQEIEFDQFGRFFGVDNDADYPGERERLVHVEQYLDGGWRANWQYLKDDYNPWIDDDMHLPWREGQPRWFTPPLTNYENGPAGFEFNPGTALGPGWENTFFLTSAPRGQQWAFRVEPEGDAFAMVDDRAIGEGVPLVGLNFAPGGALYGVDWGGGYPLNEKGAVWRIDVPPSEVDPRRERTRELIETDFSTLSEDALAEHLAWADRRVRMKAQFELAGRGAEGVLREVASEVTGPRLARLHAIWGLGQLARRDAIDDEPLAALFDDPDPIVREQVIRTATDPYGRDLGLDRIPEPEGDPHPLTDRLVTKLGDPVRRVRMQALLGLGRLRDPAATGAVVKRLGAKGNCVELTYLRHAGVMALAGCAPAGELAALAEHDSDFVRACAVIALRKRGHAAVARFLDDSDPVPAADAARAIHDDWTIPAAMPELARRLGTHRDHEGFTRRSINANFRIGNVASARRVAAFVARGKSSEALTAAGLEALRHWTEPGRLDLVVGRHRPLEPRDPGILERALATHLDAMLTSDSPAIRTTAMELAGETDLVISADTLVSVVRNRDAAGELRAQALRTLADQGAPQAEPIVGAFLDDSSSVEVRLAALEALVAIDRKRAVNEIRRRLRQPTEVPVHQHAIRQLPAVGGATVMRALLSRVADDTLPRALRLDVVEAAKAPAFAKRDAITSAVEALETKWEEKAKQDPLAPYQVALQGGDPERGESIFRNHGAAQCVRCHQVGKGAGSDVGPNLAGIGERRDRRHLLESLVLPQAEVTEGYGNVSVTLEDGSTVAGQFRGEKKGALVIRDPEGKTHRIPTGDIAERSPVVSTMPPMSAILDERELRDVVAYLASLRG